MSRKWLRKVYRYLLCFHSATRANWLSVTR